MNSLLLDRTLWDLCLDSKGNIALAANPYAIAQNVACATRLFQAELYYDTSKGVPYFRDILGRQPSLSVFKAALVQAATTVADVSGAVVYVSGIKGRKVTGQVQATTTAGPVVAVGGLLSSPAPLH